MGSFTDLKAAGGLPPARTFRGKDPDCLECNDTGFAPFIDGQGVQRVKRCQAQDCWERRIGAVPGMPDQERQTVLADWGTRLDLPDSHKPALAHAQFFVDGVHPGLYIHGSVGSGKTALACAVLNDLRKRHQVFVKFYRVTDLLRRLATADSESGQFDQVVNVPVIVLDDVGADNGQSQSDYPRRMLQAIFDAREAVKHRTIWTSNLSLDELTAFLGDDERLPSRIAGAAKVVQLHGADYRIRQARKLAGKT